jgi:hypothetical protein
MYECEEQKQQKKNHPTEPSLCGHCSFFCWGADMCLEDSMFMPAYRMLHPERKQAHFHDDGTKGKPMAIIRISPSFVQEKTEKKKS